jgi:integrase
MPTIRLTEKSIQRLPAPSPDGKQALYWDTKLKGFGVLVSGTSDAKTFIVQHAVKGGLRRRVTVGPTNVLELDEAITRAKKILAEFYSGRDPKFRSHCNPNLRAALDDYLAARPNLKARSRSYYKDTINAHLGSWLDTPLRTITREMCEERLLKIAADVVVDTNGRHSGHGMANGAMRSLRAVYNFASDRAPASDPFPPCPVRLKRSWFKIKRRTRLVKFDQLATFYPAIGALENKVIADYVKFILFTGTRRSEAAGLRWDAIDFRAKTILFKGEDVKNSEHFKLPMCDVVFDLLVARRAHGVVGDYVFPANSESGHIEEPKDAFVEIADATSIRVSPHDLRRTFTTVAESCDLSAYALKALINHRLPQESQGDVTGGYVVLSTERLRRAAQTVADALKALCGIAPVEDEADNVARLSQH